MYRLEIDINTDQLERKPNQLLAFCAYALRIKNYFKGAICQDRYKVITWPTTNTPALVVRLSYLLFGARRMKMKQAKKILYEMLGESHVLVMLEKTKNPNALRDWFREGLKGEPQQEVYIYEPTGLRPYMICGCHHTLKSDCHAFKMAGKPSGEGPPPLLIHGYNTDEEKKASFMESLALALARPFGYRRF